MATGYGGWQTERTGGAGSRMGGRSSGLPTGDGKEACGSKSVPGKEQRVDSVGGSASKGAASSVSDCCKMYYPDVLRAAASRSTALQTVNLAVSLVRR